MEQKKIMLEYSERNNKVKHLEPNSVLKPLTNSLSPSEKSNGDRLSSAKIEGIQIRKKRGTKIESLYLKLVKKWYKEKQEKK